LARLRTPEAQQSMGEAADAVAEGAVTPAVAAQRLLQGLAD
jgi:hypothetical protein